jgi:8-oxo-dGTP diphosphatase
MFSILNIMEERYPSAQGNSMTEDCFHLGLKALLCNKEGRLLLLRKNATHEAPYWDLPGGRVQKNESVEEALKREVYEETGLQNMTQIIPFFMTLTSSRIRLPAGDVGLIFKVYLCQIEDDCPIQLSNEHTHYEWVDPAQAVELLASKFPSELLEKVRSI